MPGRVRKWIVNDDLLQELRRKFLTDLDETQLELYHPADIERVKKDDWFLARYILHQKQDLDKALAMMKDSFQWRKDFGINDFSASKLPEEHFSNGAVFAHNVDRNGFTIITVKTKMHIRDTERLHGQQQFFAYWVEKALRQSGWGVVTVVFDCTDSGIGNLDLDIMKFIVSLFKKYYPWSLGYFLVYNMPWIFSAAWKIIKAWVPKESAEKIQFVTSETISEYIPEDQLLEDMGGKASYRYIYDREEEESSWDKAEEEGKLEC